MHVAPHTNRGVVNATGTFPSRFLIFTIYNTFKVLFFNIKMVLKRRNKIMIIDITKDLNNSFRIVFTQRLTANGTNFRGLMLFTFKTNNSELFENFTDYGRWLNEKDKNVILLLRLFRTSKQNSTSYNIS